MVIITLFAIGLLLGIPIHAVWRGAKTAVPTVISLAIGGLLARFLGSLLGSYLDISGRGDLLASQGIWQLLLLIPLFLLAFICGSAIANQFEKSTDPFDWFFAGTAGIIGGIFTTHLFLQAFLLTAHGLPSADLLDQAFLVRQLVYFDGWHAVSDWLANIPSARTGLPAEYGGSGE